MLTGGYLKEPALLETIVVDGAHYISVNKCDRTLCMFLFGRWACERPWPQESQVFKKESTAYSLS